MKSNPTLIEDNSAVTLQIPPPMSYASPSILRICFLLDYLFAKAAAYRVVILLFLSLSHSF